MSDDETIEDAVANGREGYATALRISGRADAKSRNLLLHEGRPVSVILRGK
jgi:hypothetical protein